MAPIWKHLLIFMSFGTVFVANSTQTNVTNQEAELQGLEITLRMVTYCDTPNNDTGFCMPLSNCSKLFEQIENPKAKTFLLESKCGPKNDNMTNPKVCCGKYNNFRYLTEQVLPKKCGRQNVTVRGRIFGGREASLGEFPWLARLFHKSGHAKIFGCSGFLIAPKFVLTAGHCLESDNVENFGPIFEVHLGVHNTRTKSGCDAKNTTCDDKVQVIRVKQTIVHPSYSTSDLYHHNDIGLIHLKKSAVFTTYVSPICVMDSIDFEPFEYWLSGWGRTESAQQSNKKLKVSVPPFPHSNCTKKYGSIHIKIMSRQLCAGGKKNQDSCTGDSGGPLMLVKDSKSWFAAGVVSYGVGCGTEGWPAVYTNITSYSDWIKKTIFANVKHKSTTETMKLSFQ